MAGNNGHEEYTVQNDMTIEGAKALFPDMAQGPLIGGMLESGNPGVRLIANDDSTIDMLKIVYLEDNEEALNIAGALSECDEFLMNDDGKTKSKRVLQRIEWIKYLLACKCSVKGRFAHGYMETSTGVLTSSMSERGWVPLNIPMGKTFRETRDNKDSNSPRRP